jgi:hypothetical protein
MGVPRDVTVTVNGSTVILQPNNGGQKGTVSCSCQDEGGSCVAQISPGVIQCVPGQNSKCKACGVSTTKIPRTGASVNAVTSTGVRNNAP